MSEPRNKVTHIGAPAVFALEQACKQLRDAFPEQREDAYIGIYIVGSCLERPDWRDVDVRMMMDDASFLREFPGINLDAGTWEFDPRWCLMVVAISQWMSKATGLPIDFQFQPMTHTNKRHKGKRHAMGLTFVREPEMVPPLRERVALDAASIGVTLRQEPEPTRAPEFRDPVAMD